MEDAWILSRLQRAKAATEQAFEDFEFHRAALGLYDFVYGDLCDWYLELIKPRLYADDNAEVSAVALHVLRETLALAHPVTFGLDGHVEMDDEDVTTAIRAAEIDRLVPSVARHPEVRKVMRERQRALALAGDSVIEGRDIGTVVAPEAEVKVFLLADEDERARRRTNDRPGVSAETLAADLRSRDERDAVNTRLAADAVLLDTTLLSPEDVVARIVELVEARR